MNKRIIYVLFSLLITTSIADAHLYKEKEYQKHWCSLNNGQTEVILQDNTRIDCLTKDYAIEFDFANKWAESIGQSLYYAACTDKKAGIVLIMENKQKDLKYLKRLKTISEKYNIQVWTISPTEMPTYSNCRNCRQ